MALSALSIRNFRNVTCLANFGRLTCPGLGVVGAAAALLPFAGIYARGAIRLEFEGMIHSQDFSKVSVEVNGVHDIVLIFYLAGGAFQWNDCATEMNIILSILQYWCSFGLSHGDYTTCERCVPRVGAR